jgi:hypothetical protein
MNAVAGATQIGLVFPSKGCGGTRLLSCVQQNGASVRGQPWAAVHTQSHNRTHNLFGEEVVEGFYGGEFVFFYVEDGVELGDVEDVLDFFGEAQEL